VTFFIVLYGEFALIEIELSDLRKFSDEVSTLLREKLSVEVTSKGDILMVPETANGQRFSIKDVKMQMKRVLHHLGLSHQYRVLEEHHKIRIVKVKESPKHPTKQKGSPAPPSQTLPYLFP
jgi:hypothetical protein